MIRKVGELYGIPVVEGRQHEVRNNQMRINLIERDEMSLTIHVSGRNRDIEFMSCNDYTLKDYNIDSFQMKYYLIDESNHILAAVTQLFDTDVVYSSDYQQCKIFSANVLSTSYKVIRNTAYINAEAGHSIGDVLDTSTYTQKKVVVNENEDIILSAPESGAIDLEKYIVLTVQRLLDLGQTDTQTTSLDAYLTTANNKTYSVNDLETSASSNQTPLTSTPEEGSGKDVYTVIDIYDPEGTIEGCTSTIHAEGWYYNIRTGKLEAYYAEESAQEELPVTEA